MGFCFDACPLGGLYAAATAGRPIRTSAGALGQRNSGGQDLAFTGKGHWPFREPVADRDGGLGPCCWANRLVLRSTLGRHAKAVDVLLKTLVSLPGVG